MSRTAYLGDEAPSDSIRRRYRAQEYVDIVAYILKFNEVPMTGDLPSDADALKKITIKKKE